MRTLFPIAVVLLILFALPASVVFAADLLGYGPELNTSLERRLGVSHRVAIALPAAVVLFCVPLVLILLYFLRLKRKSIPVPSTFLWKKSVEDLHVNRLMQWIRRNVLLLLQVLAALLMIYAVLGPRMHGALVGGKHYILLVDTSASMSATDTKPAFADRLAWAKDEALKEIDAATDADSGMVIEFNDVAQIRQSYTTNRALLRDAVKGITGTQRPTHLDEALTLAASLANPNRSTENEVAAPVNAEPGKERTYVAIEGMQADLHLFSDGKFPPVPDFALTNLNLTYHTPPVPNEAGASNNLAIVRFDAERDPEIPSRVIARASVRNYRSAPVTPKVRLEVLEGGTRVVGRYEEDKRPGETDGDRRDRSRIPPRSERPDLTFTLPDVPDNADLTLRLAIEDAADAFPADDEAWVVLGLVRKAKVLVVGPPNQRLRDFLDSTSAKKLAEVVYFGPDVLNANADPKSYATPAREGRYDLVVFDRCGPSSVDAMPASNTLFIGHPPPPYLPADKAPDPNAVKAVAGPMVRGWQARHPVMAHLRNLDQIKAAEGFQMPEWPPRTVRLMEGDSNLVLLGAIPRQAYTDLVLAFPLMTADGKWNTDWPLNVSFPLFLRNVLFAMGNVRDAGTEDAIKPGGVKLLRLGGVGEVSVTAPDGSTSKLNRGPRADFAVANTDKLGVYAVRWTDPPGPGTPGGEQLRRFAVNLFDPLESDLAPVSEVTVGALTVSAGEPRKQPRDLWKWPVLLGLLVLVAEWWVYNKRVQI